MTTYQDPSVAPSTAYSYVVYAIDGAGNVSGSSNTVAVTTPALPPDGTPPTAPGNLQATDVQATSVRLSWDASTDPGGSGVARYDLFRPDGVFLASVLAGVTTYQDPTVDPTTAYSYVVYAIDAAGNVSGPSNTLNVTTPAVPSTLTFTPTDDASIKESRPTRNYGAEPDLWVDASSRKDTLLRFAVSGLGGATVTRVRLRLYVTDSSSSGGTVFQTLAATWSEATVTWDTAPATAAALGVLGAVVAGSWVELDLTGLITADGLLSFRLTSTNANGADYASQEHPSGFAPQLVVDLG